MMEERIKTDITVIGGGLAGVCAAIAAARLGSTVSLVQNRPVLGGNSSSEVRVWVCGATKHGINRYSRETGIMGELFVENQYRNPDGNPYYWDALLLEKVRAEKNIQLFLNTDVHEVETVGTMEDRHIRSVTGWMMGSERRIQFDSDMYLDCTGDGLVGFLGGAKYRMGREANHEYNESLAPDEADDILLGSTILFYTKEEKLPVKYVPPAFAKNIEETPIPINRVIRSGDSGCHYWWIEWGGELDTVHDNERIRDELWSVIYGIWDYIKNSGKFDAENMTLEWVGSVPGKREYRRFLGDYVLTQNDIEEQTEFEDKVAFGGWSIDLHPPQGMYAEGSGASNLQGDGNYHIPFRSLYSVNTSNLLFAGRNISATHVAFGTTRVMATCAVMGEAAGTGASLCVKHQVTPRKLKEEYMTELQQTLLRQDASLIGVKNEDEADLARQATVTASSYLSCITIEDGEPYPLTTDVGQTIPIEGKLSNIELLIDATETTELQVELWTTGKPQNYIPAELVEKTVVPVTTGKKQWKTVSFDYNSGDTPHNVFLLVRENPAVHLYLAKEPFTGVISYVRQKEDEGKLHSYVKDSPILHWSMKPVIRRPFCLRVDEETMLFTPTKVIDGFVRPYGGPHLWVSEKLEKRREEWLELTWDRAINGKEVHLTFNDDVNEDLINLHHHRTPFEIIPELVKDYRVEALIKGEWHVLQREKGNRKRKRVHQLSDDIAFTAIRVVIEATNGSPRAELIEVRVY